jgi:hypothetical protein
VRLDPGRHVKTSAYLTRINLCTTKEGFVLAACDFGDAGERRDAWLPMSSQIIPRTPRMQMIRLREVLCIS